MNTRSRISIDVGVSHIQRIFQEDLSFRQRKRALHCIAVQFRQISLSEAHSLITKMKLRKDMLAFLKLLLSCGDCFSQQCIMLIITKFALCTRDWKCSLKKIFAGDSSVLEAVDLIIPDPYDELVKSCRSFLNVVNDSTLVSKRVHSLVCLHASVGKTELKPLKGHDKLWLDFSPGSGELQITIGEDFWTRIAFGRKNIRCIKCRNKVLGEVETRELQLEVNSPYTLPSNPPLIVDGILVVVKYDEKFRDLEQLFLKELYANCYLPESVEPMMELKKPVDFKPPKSVTSYESSSSKRSLGSISLSSIERDPSLLNRHAHEDSGCSCENRGTRKRKGPYSTSTPLNQSMKIEDGKRLKENVVAANNGGDTVAQVEGNSTGNQQCIYELSTINQEQTAIEGHNELTSPLTIMTHCSCISEIADAINTIHQEIRKSSLRAMEMVNQVREDLRRTAVTGVSDKIKEETLKIKESVENILCTCNSALKIGNPSVKCETKREEEKPEDES